MVVAREDVASVSAEAVDCEDVSAAPSALTIAILGLDVTVAVAVAVTVKSTVWIDGEAVVTRVVISFNVEMATETTVVMPGVCDLDEVSSGPASLVAAPEPPSTLTTL